MKDLSIKDIIGYVKSQIVFEENECEFYLNAMNRRQKETPAYESFKSGYYGHLHTKNTLYDLIKLMENVK